MCYMSARVKILCYFSRCVEVELLVDTGSTYTWIKRERLEKLGVRLIMKYLDFTHLEILD